MYVLNKQLLFLHLPSNISIQLFLSFIHSKKGFLLYEVFNVVITSIFILSKLSTLISDTNPYSFVCHLLTIQNARFKSFTNYTIGIEDLLKYKLVGQLILKFSNSQILKLLLCSFEYIFSMRKYF